MEQVLFGPNFEQCVDILYIVCVQELVEEVRVAEIDALEQDVLQLHFAILNLGAEIIISILSAHL